MKNGMKTSPGGTTIQLVTVALDAKPRVDARRKDKMRKQKQTAFGKGLGNYASVIREAGAGSSGNSPPSCWRALDLLGHRLKHFRNAAKKAAHHWLFIRCGPYRWISQQLLNGRIDKFCATHKGTNCARRERTK